MTIFTYGSLMFPEVWSQVTGLAGPGVPGQLRDYAARALRGEKYPALVAASGEVTEGLLYREVPAEAVKRLDEFEGSFYRRVEVTVRTDRGSPEPAWVYLASDARHPCILPERWDGERFRREGLGDFLRNDPGFRNRGREV